MRRLFIYFAASLLLSCSAYAVCVSCGSGSSTGTIRYNLTGVLDKEHPDIYCINNQINFSFKSLSTLRQLSSVHVYVFFNGTRIASVASGFDGTASYAPKHAGTYRLVFEKGGYRTVDIEIEAGSCVRKPTTTTSTTTTSTTTTTTSTTTTSSSSTSTSTTLQGIRQQPGTTLFSAALFASAVLALAWAVLFLKRRF